MESIKKNIWILILLFGLLVVFIPIKIPNNIPVYAKILPAKEFITIKGSNGQIISHLVNNFTGIVENVKTIQVDREDFASFNLTITNPNVLKGDTIAIFSSSHTNFIIEEVKGAMLEQEQFLESQLTGEKESIINEQEKIYEISKVNYSNQKPISERKFDMYNNELISEEEYDLAKNLLERLKLEEEREFQKLQVLKTGVKKEDITVTKERINNLKNQAEILANRVSDYKIIAPFDGTILGSNSLDTLFTLSEINSYVVLIPIKIDISNSIQIGQKLNFPDSESLTDVIIKAQDSQIKLINGEKFVIYKSYFQTDNNLLNGIFECSIVGEEKTVFDILLEKFYSIFNFS